MHIDTATGRTVPDTDAPIEHPSITKLREEMDAIGLQVLTGFTLADAMREGASVTRQKFGGWVEGESACALGAAYISAQARGYAG